MAGSGNEQPDPFMECKQGNGVNIGMWNAILMLSGIFNNSYRPCLSCLFPMWLLFCVSFGISFIFIFPSQDMEYVTGHPPCIEIQKSTVLKMNNDDYINNQKCKQQQILQVQRKQTLKFDISI